jgi:1-acyl-sn-glycerol-3-phosphate acyltransferase
MTTRAPTRRSRALRAAIRGVLWRLARVRVEGAHNIPLAGPCLLVFNQVSVIDTALLSVVVPRADVT